MVLSTVLVAVAVALVVLTSVVGRAKRAVSAQVHNNTIERELAKNVDALGEMHAQIELLRLKRETLEATGVSRQRTANLLRDFENAITNSDNANAVTRDDHGAQGGSAWN